MSFGILYNASCRSPVRAADSLVTYIYLRRASALPSNIGKAMRDASVRRTARYRFLRFFILIYYADERKTEVILIKVMS